MSTMASGILVVDDDPGLAGTLGEFLEREGYQVQTALSAAEAMAALEAGRPIALALIDLMMPGTGAWS